MKKNIFIFMFLFCSACYADSLFIYDNPSIPQWAFQIIYKEKYFENSTYYVKYNILDAYSYVDNSYTGTLRGLEYNLLLRLGLPDDYVINAGFDLIFQKTGTLNYNNLQAIDFMIEKKINFVNVMAGFKVPIWFDMEANSCLIDKRERLDFLTGLSAELDFNRLKFSFAFFNEENLLTDNYVGTKDVILTAGVDFITNELQKAGLYFENDFRINTFDNLESYVYYFTPYVKINFYNGFYFIAGVEFYLYAENVFINEYDKPQYVFKLNYVMNGNKGKEEEKKEEEKVKFEKKKWWQIEGVDDEMIPNSWKEMEEPADE